MPLTSAEINLLIKQVNEGIELRRKVNELLLYLRLPKFNSPENWVNVQDIFNRLEGQ